MELIVFILLVVLMVKVYKHWNEKRKHEEEEQKRLEEHKRYEEQQKKAIEEILSSKDFKKDLKFIEDISRCFNLAGGLDPFLPCIYKYGEEKYKLIIEKHGYDLWTHNLRDYYNNPAPKCYEALNLFAIDLFGERAEEMKKFISMEFIADHLIELENSDSMTSDYVLRYEFTVTCLPEWNYNGDVSKLYVENLFKDQHSSMM